MYYRKIFHLLFICAKKAYSQVFKTIANDENWSELNNQGPLRTHLEVHGALFKTSGKENEARSAKNNL